MNADTIHLAIMATLAALMIGAAASDMRSRTISNRLNAAIALLAIPFWLASGLDPWPGMALQFAAALAAFLVFAALFAFGAMGGGDVKMIGAVMLWVPIGLMMPTLTVMAIGGGLVSAVMLLWSRMRPPDAPVQVPYGVAIAAAGLWALHQHYLNQFQIIALS